MRPGQPWWPAPGPPSGSAAQEQRAGGAGADPRSSAETRLFSTASRAPPHRGRPFAMTPIMRWSSARSVWRLRSQRSALATTVAPASRQAGGVDPCKTPKGRVVRTGSIRCVGHRRINQVWQQRGWRERRLSSNASIPPRPHEGLASDPVARARPAHLCNALQGWAAQVVENASFAQVGSHCHGPREPGSRTTRLAPARTS